MSERYDGKPFLRLLDSYVLWSIGHLDEASTDALQRMEPKLRDVYGHEGSWSQIVEQQMAFPTTLSGKINEIWQTGAAKALAQGFDADPHVFTQQFVDANFPT